MSFPVQRLIRGAGIMLLACLPLLVGCGGGAVAEEYRPEATIDRWDDAAWQEVLATVATDRGFVRWNALKNNENGVRDTLYQYVGQVGAASPANRPELFQTENDRLAYYLNAYNALAMYGVVKRGYPGNVLMANPVVPGALFFTDQFVVGGSKTNLDSLEKTHVLNASGRDPRMHFALNCMSYSCPPLRREPFAGDRLDEQLDDQGVRYLNDPRAVRLDGDKAKLNDIFTDFYKGDFLDAGKARGADGLLESVRLFAGPNSPLQEATDVGGMGYDWSLNRPPS